MVFIPYFLGFIIIFNIALAFTIIFLERKDPQSTWAWLMVLLFIPIAGFFLYLIFGKNLSRQRIFTWDTKSRLGVKKAVQAQMRALEEDRFVFKHPDIAAYKDLYFLHLRNNDAIFTQDNRVDIYTDGKEKFAALIKDLEQATDHIHLLYYIIRYDQLGKQIADCLVKKANEGVEVRVLYDDMGSRSLSRKFIKRIRRAGGQIEAFFPPKIPKVNFKINYRNHRKLAIIDGRIGYIGGFNIGDEYLGKAKKFGYWRDNHLRVVGDAVTNMQTRFILDWNQASRNDILYEDRYYAAVPEGDVGIQIVSSGPDSEWEQIKNGYIKMILSAKEYVYVQTPYFIPDESLRDALRIAALSGVNIKVMIPNKPDHPFVYWATLSYVGDLLNAGAEVYIYQNGFLHAKTIIVDGKIASVGTANIDVRSFRLNFEVNAFLYDAVIAEKLVEAFQHDISLSTQMTKKLYEKRSLGIRFKESLSRLLSPIL
ncbi:cardiolipin synthase [Virgibacillus dakarensis]|uniref:Cardiolipin synthase n=1 Tax=Lentibacillus populi TaxID=1827502 RepID=A0A9W5TVY7_9BACI|nr:cardiolipin synthase [Lentibacillus populi]MBT2215224.1 cardiolipin synthase [Virgibacillus dakarensis]MTW87733.1 cardiolipin synthase [Virgibacillus dakarensis]GGB35331.1 major cardiolipin synthase ClsA [Lentibacillus populi]